MMADAKPLGDTDSPEVDRLRAENLRLQRHIEQLDRLFSLSLDLICVATTDGRFETVNPAFEQLLGFSEAEVLARPILSFVHPDDLQATRDELAQLDRGEPTVRFENRYLTASGDLRWIAWKAVPRPQEGRIYAVGRDVTEAKALERGREQHAAALARTNRELDQFAAAVSHDLKEPLRAVTGYLSLLMRRHAATLPEDGASHVQAALDAAMRMGRMIDGLLAYARLGRAGPDAERRSLDEALDAALENLAASLDASGIELHRRPLPDYQGPAERLTSLFQNLLANALRYAVPVDPRVEIEGALEDGRVRVWVRDHGPGVPSGAEDQVFELFRRLQGPDEPGGHGLGLSVCRRIVEAEGGRIGVEAGPDGGASFWFELPELAEAQP
jgi:PAS domain S-box-containing protein